MQLDISLTYGIRMLSCNVT